MKKYALVEAEYCGADVTIFDTKEDAQIALQKAYTYAQRDMKSHPEDSYITESNALVKSDYVEDLWYGVIKEIEL